MHRDTGVIYAAFATWLILALFLGYGIGWLLAGLVRPKWLNWALLPGTIVSEMAYIFGCLVTGGEVRHARLMDAGDAAGNGRKGAPSGTQAGGGLKLVSPLVASLLSIAACGAGILAAHSLLGKPVIREFLLSGAPLQMPDLPRDLPTTYDGLWYRLSVQVQLLRGMCDTWGRLKWLDWRVPLFVYLSLCLAVRLAPPRRPVRPHLAAAAAVAGVIALIGAMSERFTTLVADLWPLLTYVWSLLLFVLVAALLVRGAVALVRVLAGRPAA